MPTWSSTDDLRISARPSDSVAIALRVGVPIYAEEAVLDGGRSGDAGRARGRGREVQGIPRSVSPDDFKATDG